MQVWTEIRRKVLVEKVSVRQICRDYGLSHHTVKKMLDNVEPPGYQRCPVGRHWARAHKVDPSSLTAEELHAARSIHDRRIA